MRVRTGSRDGRAGSDTGPILSAPCWSESGGRPSFSDRQPDDSSDEPSRISAPGGAVRSPSGGVRAAMRALGRPASAVGRRASAVGCSPSALDPPAGAAGMRAVQAGPAPRGVRSLIDPTPPASRGVDALIGQGPPLIGRGSPVSCSGSKRLPERSFKGIHRGGAQRIAEECIGMPTGARAEPTAATRIRTDLDGRSARINLDEESSICRTALADARMPRR
jgi:hypothetical protein